MQMILTFFKQYWGDFLNVIGFVITILTFFTTLNVRSQVIHSHERRRFQANYDTIYGKLGGFINSLTKNNLHSDEFYSLIDVYMTELPSQYTFLNFIIKFKCEQISRKVKSPSDNITYRTTLAKQLTKLKNSISKEADL